MRVLSGSGCNKNNIKRLKDKQTKNKRRVIWEKTNGRCYYCGAQLPYRGKGKLFYTIDHLIPKAKGGSSCFTNLVPCCLDCNKGKADFTVEEYRFIKRMERFRNINGVDFTKQQLDWLEANGRKVLFCQYEFWFECQPEGPRFV